MAHEDSAWSPMVGGMCRPFRMSQLRSVLRASHWGNTEVVLQSGPGLRKVLVTLQFSPGAIQSGILCFQKNGVLVRNHVPASQTVLSRPGSQPLSGPLSQFRGLGLIFLKTKWD